MSQPDSSKRSKRTVYREQSHHGALWRLVTQLIIAARFLSAKKPWGWVFAAHLMLAIQAPARADAPCSGGAESEARPIAATLQPNASAFDPSGRFEITMQSSGDQTTDIYVRHLVGSREIFRAITRLQSSPSAVVVGRLAASEGLGFSLLVEEGGSGYRQVCTYGFRFQQDGVVSYRTLAARAVTRGGGIFAGEVTDWKSVLDQTQLRALEAGHARLDAMGKGPNGAMPSAAIQTVPKSSGTADATVLVSLNSIKKRTFAKSKDQISPSALAISPDGSWLAWSDGSNIRLVDTTTGGVLRTFAIPLLQANVNEGGGYAVSADGKRLFTGSHGLTAWDVISGKQLYDHRFYDSTTGFYAAFSHLVFSADERLLYGGTLDGYVFTLDTESGREVRKYRIWSGDRFLTYTFSPQANLGAFIEENGISLRLFDLTSGKLLPTVLGGKAPLMSARFSPDGKLLAFGSKDGTFEVWNISSRSMLFRVDRLGGGGGGLAFSPDSRQIAVALYNQLPISQGTVKIFDAASGTPIRELRHEKMIFYWVLEYSKDGRWLGVIEGGQPTLWDMKQLEPNIAAAALGLSATNGGTFTSQQIASTASAGKPDLTPSAVKAAISTLTAGDTVAVSWTMTNKGVVPARASMTGIRLRPASAADASADITLVREIATSPIDSGRSINQRYDVTMPPVTPAGRYAFLVIADNVASSGLGQTISSNDFAMSGEITIACQKSNSVQRPLVGTMELVVGGGFVDPGYALTEHREHLGTDYRATGGRCVYAMRDGKVTTNETGNADPMAAVLIVTHADGSKAVYGHIESSLGIGSKVTQGTNVGTVRRRTSSYPNFASHLHFGEQTPPTDKLLQTDKEFDKACVNTASGKWGWGRAPLGTTRDQILKCGWIDTTALHGWP